MREDLNRTKMHKAIDSTLSGLNGDPWLFQRVSARAAEGETKVKKKLSTGLVLVIVLMLIAAVALAVTLLTHQEVVEQVAVPLAVDNDTGVGVNNTYNAEELAELVRNLNENGITLEENNRIMQSLQNGQGYYEEETIMEICRQAFGGNYYTWTLEQQDWYEGLMVKIGFHETYQTRMPGEGNMKYEDAEAFAFRKIRETYGQDLLLEDRSIWQLSRQFYVENPGDPASAGWSFSLEPKDIDHGQYYVRFSDNDPEGSVSVGADIYDWSQPYTGEELLSHFNAVYTWNHGQWPQEAWQRLHEMLQGAEIEPTSREAQALKAFRITEYPVPGEKDISREIAIQKAKEAIQDTRAALDGAVLTDYEGKRIWMVSFVINPSSEGTADETAGLFAVSVDSATGTLLESRKQGMDDSIAFAYVPLDAYEKAWEGILRRSEIIQLAVNAIREKYPDLDLMDEEKYEIRDEGYKKWNVTFKAKDIHLGNVSAVVSMDGIVGEINADTEILNGDNLWKRYGQANGYFGQWEQSVWVRLEEDMSGLEPLQIGGRLLKATHYPEESSVKIQHGRAQELGMQATGKRTAEVNTCVLVDAQPHPVWIMRILTDEPDEPVVGIDAETGDVVFTEQFKTDYTPQYVLYSMPETWRKMELEMLGAPYMAKVAITHKFGDMWLDEPELDVDNTENWELQQDGLVIRYIGRWNGMKSYEVELDQNGFVLRCEESNTASMEEKPEETNGETYIPAPTPTPLPDGKPWFWGMDFAPQKFWDQLDKLFFTHVMTMDDYPAMEKDWLEAFGESEFWPQEYQIVRYLYYATEEQLKQPDLQYPVFPDRDRKSQKEICEIALNAFHEIADVEMGKEWVDSTKVGSALLNDGINPDTGKKYGKHVWWINFNVWEEEFSSWIPKGYAILDEDGNVLIVRLELSGNG
ncbi:MAG: hypothetical protein IKG87_16130 [Clostridia bacterium]|nr:hypothetical protein [Clostridia bacterium]